METPILPSVDSFELNSAFISSFPFHPCLPLEYDPTPAAFPILAFHFPLTARVLMAWHAMSFPLCRCTAIGLQRHVHSSFPSFSAAVLRSDSSGMFTHHFLPSLPLYCDRTPAACSLVSFLICCQRTVLSIPAVLILHLLALQPFNFNFNIPILIQFPP
jgi:hypothetical protein